MGNLVMHWRRFRDLREIKLHGVRLHTAQGDIPKQVRNAIFKGRYEAHECALVRKWLAPTDRVLEIGCGIGFVSLVATSICGEGNVASFEANPEMEAVIRRNFTLNGWTPNLTMSAVTADGRDIQFHRQENVLSSSIFDRDLGAEEISVRSVSINDALKVSQANTLIMDVEGAEEEILPAADLSNVKTAIIELHPHIIGADKVADLVALLEGQGLGLKETRHKTYLFAR